MANSFQYLNYLKFIKNQKVYPTFLNAGNDVTAQGPTTFANNVIGLNYSSPLKNSNNSLILDLSANYTFDGEMTFNNSNIYANNLSEVSGNNYHLSYNTISKRIGYESISNIYPSSIELKPLQNGLITNVQTISNKTDTNMNILANGTNNISITLQTSANDVSKSSIILDNSSNIILNAENSILSGNLVLTSLVGGGSTGANITNDGIIVRHNSDIRLKKNIVSIIDNSNILLNFDRLNPVQFNWNNENKYGSNLHYGFIAQEILELYPNLVFNSFKDDKGEQYLGISQDFLIPILTVVLKDKIKIIEELKTKITNIENKLVDIENKLN